MTTTITTSDSEIIVNGETIKTAANGGAARAGPIVPGVGGGSSAPAAVPDYNNQAMAILVPSKADGQGVTGVPAGNGDLVQYFDIPADLPDGPAIGWIKTASTPGTDSLSGYWELSEAFGFVSPNTMSIGRSGGGTSIAFRVGHDGGDGLPNLDRSKRYYLNAKKIEAKDGFFTEFSRPDRGL